MARSSLKLAELVGGRCEQVQNHPKVPVPDGKWAAATNRWVSVGFGAGASVRRARTRPTRLGRDNLAYKRGGAPLLIGARRRGHELAHHDGVRVLGYFGIHFFEAEFPVEVVGRLVVPDAC